MVYLFSWIGLLVIAGAVAVSVLIARKVKGRTFEREQERRFAELLKLQERCVPFEECIAKLRKSLSASTSLRGKDRAELKALRSEIGKLHRELDETAGKLCKALLEKKACSKPNAELQARCDTQLAVIAKTNKAWVEQKARSDAKIADLKHLPAEIRSLSDQLEYTKEQLLLAEGETANWQSECEAARARISKLCSSDNVSLN